MNHESSTIVRLAPGPNATNISFEEAFGEWSEARGRGRAKRTARKASKQQDKLERKTNRVQTRDAKKRVKTETRQLRRSDKNQNRQDLRLGRRSNRKVQRQDMRDEQQQRRQGRRDESKLRRVARKDFGQEEYEDPNLDSNYQQDEQGYEENYDEGYDENNQGGYNDSYDQGYDDSYDDGSEENYDQGYEDDYGYDEYPDYDADYDDYYDYQPEWEGDFGNFDGESKENDAFMVETDENVVVPKNVLETAVKIEWNKELINQLQTKGKQLVNSKTDDTAVKQALKERLSRLKDLCDAEGLFSSASGENAKVSRKAKRIARAKRAEASPSYRTSKYNRKTKVQRGIGAQISSNRIEVNAKESNSSFAGAQSIDWKPIALGVGIGVASVVLLKLTKVIK